MMNKTRTGYAVGSLLQDDMAMMNKEDMPIEETQMMPDGTEMPGATYGEEEHGSRRRNGKRIFRFYT
jgi:hypothetical protein